MKEFIEEIPKQLPDDIISETYHIIHGYKLKCIKNQVFTKRKAKIEEHWFCLKELAGKNLPRYIREGAQSTGFKSYNNFFAACGYYNMNGNNYIMNYPPAKADGFSAPTKINHT